MKNTVLIVDDDLILAQEIWSPYLESLDYRVIAVCATGAEAIEVAKSQPPGIALVDISLAGDMEGVEVAANLMAQRRPIPVIVVIISAYTQDEVPDLTLLKEGFLYLEKPFSLEQLGEVMQRASTVPAHGAETLNTELLRVLNSKADLLTIQLNGARRRRMTHHA